VDCATGKELVSVDAGAYVPGSAAVSGARAFVGHYENEALCVDIDKGTVLWRAKKRNAPFFSSPALSDKAIVIGSRNRRVYCLSRDDGKELWTFSAHGDVDSSPVISGQKVVFGSSDGKLYVVDLASGKQLWSYEIGKPLIASPAVGKGLLVIGSEDGVVYAFGPKKGH